MESISRGMGVADAVVKRASVRLLIAEAVSPGKYLLLFGGEVAEVEEAFSAGLEKAGPGVVDSLRLPRVEKGLWSALDGVFRMDDGESVGIVETHTVASGLLAADAALKGADVWLTHLRLATGIGGKAVFTLCGSLPMVEAALECATFATAPGLLLATELIQNPHPELRGPVF
jgi:microcompartment protein CcmL/EutN